MKVVDEGGPSTQSKWWSMDWGSVLCIYPQNTYRILVNFTEKVLF